MAFIDNLDFLNANALRNYPIKESLARISTNGAFTIPNDFIVDLQLAATYDPTRKFYISKISNFEDTITVEVADTTSVIVGAFTIDTTTFVRYKDYILVATDLYIGATGVLVIGSLDGIQGEPSGNYFFNLANTEFETRAIIPALKGINRLIFSNANGKSFGATGDVEIIARTNLRFSSPSSNVIVIDAGENLGLSTDCSSVLPCIKTVNGISPDGAGNFTLDFTACASLTPIPANTGLVLQDICCKPCTGCNDIEELTNRLTSAESNVLALREYYTALNALFENFRISVTYTCDCPP